MTPDQTIPAKAFPLPTFHPRAILQVLRIDTSDQDAVRLKRMGICEGRTIQLVQTGDPLIVRVVGCRVGLSRRLASKVLVTLSAECPKPPTDDDR